MIVLDPSSLFSMSMPIDSIPPGVAGLRVTYANASLPLHPVHVCMCTTHKTYSIQ